MAIKIKNLRNEWPTKPYEVRVDRGSSLGNPFKMENESQREEVCEKYEEYFKTAINENPKIKMELQRLNALHNAHGELVLYCWCTPKRCHAETIKRYLTKLLENLTC